MTSESSCNTKTTTVSAPGKVLLAGGYLLLESPNVGYVVATDKRFYSTVSTTTTNAPPSEATATPVPPSSSSSSSPTSTAAMTGTTCKILVHSPQFHSQWSYDLNMDTNGGMSLLPSSVPPTAAKSTDNPFVEKTLRVVFASLAKAAQKEQQSFSSGLLIRQGERIDITIHADNDFYSILPHLQKQEAASNDIVSLVQSLPKWLPCPQDPTTGKAIVNKTGLGSSAALVTSLVGALVLHYTPNASLTTTSNSTTTTTDANPSASIMTKIHNLAQLCHCYAQGKVGSGFDVSAAMYGSHVYTRFSKCILSDLLQQLDEPISVTHTTESLISQVISKSWWMSDDFDEDDDDDDDDGKPQSAPPKQRTDHAHAPSLPLPKGLQLFLGDVCGGSESPSMARQVLAWKKEQFYKVFSNSKIPYWKDLAQLNQTVVQLLRQLEAIQNTDDYSATLQSFSKLPSKEWKKDKETSSAVAASVLCDLRDAFLQTRQCLKSLGEAANVPIEPPEQTSLCDATMESIPGIVTCLVPGAGGYDAIACIYIDCSLLDDKNESTMRQQIGSFWSQWNRTDPNDISTIKVCPLSVQASTGGIRLES